MFDCLPFFNLEDNELLATLSDSQSNDRINEQSLFKQFFDLVNDDFYKNLKNEQFGPENFNQSFSNQAADLSCLHINIGSLNAKLDEFSLFINSLEVAFDVICLTEVWSTNIQFHGCVLQQYIFHYELPISGIVGGVGIFVRKSLQCKLRPDLNITSTNNNMIENLWIEISKLNTKYIVGCIYRHPNSSIGEFSKMLEASLCKINRRRLSCILMGDININLLKLSSEPAVRDYTNCLISNNFLPCLLIPTRVTSASSTLIDHIYFFKISHDKSSKIRCGNIICDISDHYPNFFILKNQKYIDMSARPLTRVFSPSNKIEFNAKVTSIEWSNVFNNSNDANQCCDLFVHHLADIYNQCFPLVRVSRKAHKNKAWFSTELRQTFYEKNRLFKIWRNSSDDKDKEIYIKLKKSYNIMCKNVKINYYKQLLNVRSSSIKKIWDNLNLLLGKKNKSGSPKEIEKLIYNNIVYDNVNDVANIFNQYFVNIGSNLAKALPPATTNFRCFLDPPIKNSISVYPITVEEVFSLITSMSGGAAAGDDGFNLEFLKKNVACLSQPLAHLFNLSIFSGIVPRAFKLAKVVPVFKKGDELNPGNYRPISLLSIFNKVFEKLISKRLSDFFDHENILYKHQFGFRKNHSTGLAIVEVTDFCYTNLDKNNYILGLFIDFQKAFDSIDIDILLVKLSNYGIRGIMFDWIKDYLKDRSQYTFVNGIKSEVKNINYGVPQGSVLGPLLFLIYVNDLHRATLEASPKLFADDTNIFIAANNLSDLTHKANNSLNQIYQWCLANKITINLDKTNFTVFSPNKNIAPDNLIISIGNSCIKYTSCCKYLGIFIDNKLTWQEHIDYVYKKLLKFCGIFYKIRELLPFQCLKMVYFSFVYSHIIYGIEIYANTCSSYLQRLNILNNKLIRILFNKKRFTHVTELYKVIESLPILKLHDFTVLKFVHKCALNPEALPEIFSEYFQMSKLASKYSSRRQYDLYVNQSNTTFGRKCLATKGSQMWNKLPNNIKSITNYCTFCKEVKSYIAATDGDV